MLGSRTVLRSTSLDLQSPWWQAGAHRPCVGLHRAAQRWFTQPKAPTGSGAQSTWEPQPWGWRTEAGGPGDADIVGWLLQWERLEAGDS